MAGNKDRRRDKSKSTLQSQGITERLLDFSGRYHFHLLFSILALAFILRVIALYSLSGTVYFDYMMYDERLYHNWAKALSEGTFQSSSVYEMAPLPAYFMALIYRIFSPDIIYIRIANIVLGVFACYLIYLTGRDLFNRTAGLAACLVAALYKPLIFYSIVPLNTMMSVVLFALTCCLLVSFVNRASMIKALLLGVAVCLAYNVRPNCILLIPLIALLVVWSVFRDRYSIKTIAMIFILYVLGVAVVQTPFIMRNYVKAGEASAAPSQAGLNLYICNNLDYGFPVPFAGTVPYEMGVQFTIEASRRVGKKLTSSEASRYWTEEVLNAALKRPGAFAKKQIKKLVGAFNWSDKGDHYHMGFLSGFAGFFKLPLPGFWLIFPFGMTGMCLTVFRDRRSFYLASVFAIYALTLVVFFSHARVRLPLVVILIPFAVAGFIELYLSFKNRETKKMIIYPLVLALFFVFEFIPARDTQDITAYLNSHALILSSKGLTGEAVRYWEASSIQERHFSDFANLSLAGVYHSRNNDERAFYYLDRIKDTSYAAANKYEQTGDIFAGQGRYDDAVAAYRKALEINSGLRTVRAKLINILLKMEKQEEARDERRKLEYINSFYTLYGKKEKTGEK